MTDQAGQPRKLPVPPPECSPGEHELVAHGNLYECRRCRHLYKVDRMNFGEGEDDVRTNAPKGSS
jgi:hypothetical protein